MRRRIQGFYIDNHKWHTTVSELFIIKLLSYLTYGWDEGHPREKFSRLFVLIRRTVSSCDKSLLKSNLLLSRAFYSRATIGSCEVKFKAGR